MKVFIASLTVASSLFAATTVTTTDTTVTRPRMGMEAGMLWSDVSGPSDVNTNNRAGLAAGVNIEIPTSNMVSLQPGLLFVQRGAEIMRAGDAKVVTKMNSLEIPILLKLKLNQEVSPYLAAGPLFTWNIDKKVEVQSPSGTTSVGFQPKSWDVGATVGIGADLGPVTGSLRYVWGLTSLDENSSDFKARGFYALLGIRI